MHISIESARRGGDLATTLMRRSRLPSGSGRTAQNRYDQRNPASFASELAKRPRFRLEPGLTSGTTAFKILFLPIAEQELWQVRMPHGIKPQPLVALRLAGQVHDLSRQDLDRLQSFPTRKPQQSRLYGLIPLVTVRDNCCVKGNV